MLLATIERRVAHTLAGDEPHGPASPLTHLMWFVDGVLLFTFVSWLLTSALWVDADFYYAVYIWTAMTFLWAYIRLTGSNVIAWFHVRWRLSLFFGLLASIYVVVSVLRTNLTARPTGLLFAFEIMWRGVAYGIADALVLTFFPIAVAYGVLGGTVSGARRRLLFAGLALVLVWILTAAYHLGFAQFDEDDLVSPEVSTTAISLPAIATANPLGSVVARVAMHLVVTVNTYESDVFVPPEVEFIPDWEPPGVFGPR